MVLQQEAQIFVHYNVKPFLSITLPRTSKHVVLSTQHPKTPNGKHLKKITSTNHQLQNAKCQTQIIQHTLPNIYFHTPPPHSHKKDMFIVCFSKAFISQNWYLIQMGDRVYKLG